MADYNALAQAMRDAPQPEQEVDPWKAATVARIRNGLAQYLGGVNALAPRTNEEARNMLAYATPGYGNYLAGKDAINQFGSGDYDLALGSAIGAIPFMGGMIKAFHGSPHNFERFDMSKIGTGEGAQAYGHGLYFAESPDVAGTYKRPGMHSYTVPTTLDGKTLDRVSPQSEAEARALDALKRNPTVAEAVDYLKQDRGTEAAQEWLEQNLHRIKDASHTGTMYEVNINADPEHFLDFDKPLSQQSEHVRAALPDMKPDWTGGQIHESSRLVPGDYADKVAAAKALSERGIPGIKYLDQGSRTAGEGSRNYVVFDDKLVNIVRKYGIPGAIGLGLITPEIGRQMQEQGL